jgi:hypothetical protein
LPRRFYNSLTLAPTLVSLFTRLRSASTTKKDSSSASARV